VTVAAPDGVGRGAPARPVPLRVVLVHWEQPEACVATVARFRDREVPVRVTVVDNASSPSALARLRSGLDALGAAPGDVELVEAGSNTGFGPGANRGLRRFLDDPEDGTWVALAPHDVDPRPGCLAALLDAAAGEPMAGLLCADVGDGMVPVIDPYFGGMVVPAPDDGTGPPLPRWEDAAYPHGTLMLLRRECLDEVGVFDERFFSYCEEADLALRARRAGWRVGLVRGARVQNLHLGSSVPLVDYLQTRNTLLLVAELSGPYHAFIRTCITLLQVLRGWRDPGARPLVFDARARLLGVRDFLLRRFGPPPAAVTDR
jgi:GT2 family glycosyltransferase